MHFGSKYAYLGNDQEDKEEVKIDEEDGIVLSDSDVSDDDGESCLLDIFDTAGQEEYSSLKDRYVRKGNGFVIIYSITDRESFNEAEAVFKWLKRLRDEDAFCILVANKQDLKDEAIVSQTEGQDLASRLNIPFYETSAKTGQGVQDAMHGLVRLIPRTGSDYKIVMLGSGAVGKSCITLRFVNNTFLTDYDPTVEDSYRKMINVSGLNAVSKDVKKAKKNNRRKRRSSNPDIDLRTHQSAPAVQQNRPRSGFMRKILPGSLVKAFSPLKRSIASSQPPRAPNALAQVKKVQQRKADGNVVLIELGSLAEDPKLVTGDAVKCAQCSAVLTSTSTLVPDGDKKIWNCEFCGHANHDLDIDDDEIPKGDCLDYMLSPATKPKEEENKEEATATRKETTPGVIVYCMDISSSMQTNCDVPESHRAWREERTSGAETVDRVSRLDCIRKAVERLAKQLKEEQPEKQILLTVFSSEVCVKGGGPSHTEKKFDGLENMTFEQLLEKGLALTHDYPLRPLSESYGDITKAVEGLRTTGCTALGPALSICTGFVSKMPTSEIVLCTDGEPNVGIGSLGRGFGNQGGNAEEFYTMIGNYARSKNITINILAVEGASVGLQTVSAAAENSGGTTNKLNPMEIVRQLRTIAQNEIIASSVTVRFLLHPDFVLDEQDFGENLSQLEKEVGAARKDSDLIFRYKLRDPSKKTSLDKVPFQFQITYTRPDGMVCFRVLSKAVETTSSRQSMEQNIDVSVIGMTAMKKTAKLAQAGKSKEAQAMLKNVKRMVHRGAVNSQQKEERLAFEEEVYSLDTELTDNNRAYSSVQQSDYSANVVQQVYSKNMSSHQAVSKKMNKVMSRKMAPANVTSYYDYKDSY